MTKVIETFPEVEELIKTYKTETVAEEALRLLSEIPENKWCKGTFTYFGNGPIKHCAIGWISELKNEPIPTAINSKNCIIAHKVHDFLNPIHIPINKISGLAIVNDGKDERYQQPTPKQRVIALLQDMIKAGF